MAPTVGTLFTNGTVITNGTLIANGTLNGTAPVPTRTGTTEWWEVKPHRGLDYFLVYGILGFFIFSFLGIVIVDMKRKSRTGELRETLGNLLGILIVLVKLPYYALHALAIWIANLFRKDENKRRPSDAVNLERDFNSQAIINRLASSHLRPEELESNRRKQEIMKSTTVEVTEKSDGKGKSASDPSTNNHTSTNVTNPDNALFIVGDNLVDVPLGGEGGMDFTPGSGTTAWSPEPGAKKQN